MSDSESSDEVCVRPSMAFAKKPAVPAAPAAADAGEDTAAAKAREAAEKAAAAKRGMTMSPPPADWEWQIDVLQADGATAVDNAVAQVFGGKPVGSVAAPVVVPTFTTTRAEVEYWSGEPLDELCDAIADDAAYVALDAEWLIAASQARPRPGLLARAPTRAPRTDCLALRAPPCAAAGRVAAARVAAAGLASVAAALAAAIPRRRHPPSLAAAALPRAVNGALTATPR